jgi:hypothetical protein
LVNSLTPRILKLRKESAEPITAYIDSNGGYPALAETLLSLLRAPDADGRKSPLVTVVTGTAASAAADLLACGGYVIAYPHATIHFHGTRRESQLLTMESAETTAKLLRAYNETAAMDLAANIVARSMFIYVCLEESFSKLREKKPELSDVECFARSLFLKLSRVPEDLPLNALARYDEVQRLSDFIFRKIKIAKGDPTAKIERSILKSIIDYEFRNTKKDPNWNFNEENLDRIVEDFRVIKDFHIGSHTGALEPLVKKFGRFFLSKEDTKTFKETKFPDEAAQQNWLREKAEPRLQPLWYFIVSVCRLLQEKENPLTASDAYWLGIVHEVVGSDLRCLRQVWEYKPSAAPATAEAGSSTAPTQQSGENAKN